MVVAGLELGGFVEYDLELLKKERLFMAFGGGINSTINNTTRKRRRKVRRECS